MALRTVGLSYVGWAGGNASLMMQRWLFSPLAVVLAAVVIATLALVAGGGSATSAGVAAGIEASVRRWSALATEYAIDCEAIAAAGAARYQAMAKSLGFWLDASTLCWNAVAATYGAEAERSAVSASVSTARYEAMAEALGFGFDAETARWNAAAAQHDACLEHTRRAMGSAFPIALLGVCGSGWKEWTWPAWSMVAKEPPLG